MIIASGNVRKFSGARGDALGPCDERLGIEGTLHIIAILATGPTILRCVTLGRIESVNTVDTRLEIKVVAVHTWEEEHRTGFLVGQVPFDFALDGSPFDGTHSMIYISSIPFGNMTWIFSTPRTANFVIMLSIVFWAFF